MEIIKGKIPSVTTHREGGGAGSRNRPRSPAAASAAGFRGGDSRAPRIRRREQVTETQRTDRTRDAGGGPRPRKEGSRSGRARRGDAAGGGGVEVCDVPGRVMWGEVGGVREWPPWAALGLPSGYTTR